MNSLSRKFERRIDHQTRLELAEALRLARRGIHTLELGLHVPAGDRYARIDQGPDLDGQLWPLAVDTWWRSQRCNMDIVTHLEIGLAPLRCPFECETIQGGHLRGTDIHPVPVRVPGDNRTEHQLFGSRYILPASALIRPCTSLAAVEVQDRCFDVSTSERGKEADPFRAALDPYPLASRLPLALFPGTAQQA